MHVSRPPIQRTNTLGPTSAIQDWELERVLMIAQLQQFRERVDYVEKKAAADKEIYDQHRSSLLKQIKLKDIQLEKRILSMQAQHESQIELLQQHREQDKQEYQDELEDLRSRYERILQTEQQKHQRRISGFEQRLSAKQDSYVRQTQSAPSSPTRSHHYITSSSSPSDSENIPVLLKRLTDLQNNHDQEKRTWQAEKEDLIKQYSSRLAIQYPTASKDEESDAVSSRKVQKAYIQGAQAVYQERVRKIEAGNKIKMDAMAAKHQRELEEMKERFMHEAQEVAMHTEARIHNLVTEHAQVLAELREEHGVFMIEHQVAMNDLEDAYKDAQDEAVAACEQRWQTKVADVTASMSADATAVQAHWEARVEEATVGREAEFLRLMAEIGVLRDRLNKEIIHHRDTRALLDNARQQIAIHKKIRAAAEQACQHLKREQKQIRTLAAQLVSITDPIEQEEHQAWFNNVPLADLLNRAISNASVMHSRYCITQKNEEGSSSSFFGGHFLSGFLP